MNHYCQDSCLELRGCRGPRWPHDPTKYTFYLCYVCGKTWQKKESPLNFATATAPKLAPVKKVTVKYDTAGYPTGFTVYKIMDGVMGMEVK